jgi:hypothetical protein
MISRVTAGSFVDVELISDNTAHCVQHSGVEPLAKTGVPVMDRLWRADRASEEMVIDGLVTPSGSYIGPGALRQIPKTLT